MPAFTVVSRVAIFPVLLAVALVGAGCEEDLPAGGDDASVTLDGSAPTDGGLRDEGPAEDQGSLPDATSPTDTA
jgi:hypothetical protein